MILNIYSETYSVYIKYLSAKPTFWSVLLHNQPFSRCKVVENPKSRKFTEESQNGLQHVTSNYPVYTKYMYLPTRSIFWPAALNNQPFSRYKVVKNRKNRKCTEWPQHVGLRWPNGSASNSQPQSQLAHQKPSLVDYGWRQWCPGSLSRKLSTRRYTEIAIVLRLPVAPWSMLAGVYSKWVDQVTDIIGLPGIIICKALCASFDKGKSAI